MFPRNDITLLFNRTRLFIIYTPISMNLSYYSTWSFDTGPSLSIWALLESTHCGTNILSTCMHRVSTLIHALNWTKHTPSFPQAGYNHPNNYLRGDITISTKFQSSRTLTFPTPSSYSLIPIPFLDISSPPRTPTQEPLATGRLQWTSGTPRKCLSQPSSK